KRDFRKTFSQTPAKWLKDMRLDKAHFLISEKKQKPSEVYLQVGFENFSHFSASFKERFGYNASIVLWGRPKRNEIFLANVGSGVINWLSLRPNFNSHFSFGAHGFDMRYCVRNFGKWIDFFDMYLNFPSLD